MRSSDTSSTCFESTGPADARRRSARRCIVMLAALLLIAGPAAAQKAEQRLAQKVQAAVGKAGKSTRVGVVVRNLKTGATVFEQNGGEMLKPASVLKLFTTAAALLRLGPDFHFETALYRVNDELWVIGGGDPGLADERLLEKYKRPRDAVIQDWIRAIKAAGDSAPIRAIVVDDSIFDREFRHPSWPADQNVRWYQAPVGGLNFNDNCLDSAVAVEKGRLMLSLTPALPASMIENRLSMGKQHTAIVKRDPGSDVFVFSGAVAKAGGFESVAVNEPTIFFASAFAEALRGAGVALSPELRLLRQQIRPALLEGRRPLHVHKTSLLDCVWRANTFSQNLFAEALLKSVAAYGPGGRREPAPGSFAAGTRAVADALARAGVDLKGGTLVDGSGLSHDNRVSAAQIVRLLQVMHGEAVGRAFRDSLAEPGSDGTLKRRYGDAAFKGALRAKTGTIQGVSGLAGYVTRPDGTEFAFAVLANGPAAADIPPQVARALAE